MLPINSSISTTRDRCCEAALRTIVCAIVLICVFDIFCTVRYAEDLGLNGSEKNPIAAMLIRVEYETRYQPPYEGCPVADRTIIFRSVDVSGLILFKTLGLLAAVYLLEGIIRHANRRMAIAVVVPVFGFQLALLARLLS